MTYTTTFVNVVTKEVSVEEMDLEKLLKYLQAADFLASNFSITFDVKNYGRVTGTYVIRGDNSNE